MGVQWRCQWRFLFPKTIRRSSFCSKTGAVEFKLKFNKFRKSSFRYTYECGFRLWECGLGEHGTFRPRWSGWTLGPFWGFLSTFSSELSGRKEGCHIWHESVDHFKRKLSQYQCVLLDTFFWVFNPFLKKSPNIFFTFWKSPRRRTDLFSNEKAKIDAHLQYR